MTKLKKLELVNFLSYERAEISLDQGGVVLVLGENRDSQSTTSNGSGKSALLADGIVWALFGRTLRGITGDEVVRGYPDCVSEGCCATLHLEKDGHKYEVRRYQKHPRRKNSLVFLCDASDLSSSKRETQQLIEKTFGLAYDLFCRSVILGQDSLLFATATDVQRKEILERVMGMESFDLYLQKAKRFREGVRKGVEDSHAREETLSSNIELRARDVAQLRKAKEEFSSDKERQIAALEREIAELSQEKRKDLRGEKEKVGALCESSEERVATLSGLFHKLSSELKMKQEQYRKASQDVCPTCGRPFDKESLEETRKSLEKEMEKTRIELTTVTEQLDAAKQSVKKWRSKLRDIEKVVVKEALIEERLRALGVRVEELRGQEWQGESRLLRCLEELKRFKKELEEVRSRRQELQEELRYWDFVVKLWGPKGLRSYLLDLAVGTLNQAANRLSEVLTDGEVRISFTTQKELKNGQVVEDFSVEVENVHGARVYKGSSAGERQRIDLCIAGALKELARARAAFEVNVEVWDEVCTHIDVLGEEKVLKLLSKENGRTIFFITHKETFRGLFPKVLTVVKENGVSRLQGV